LAGGWSVGDIVARDTSEPIDLEVSARLRGEELGN
jgi:hypothetical protein